MKSHSFLVRSVVTTIALVFFAAGARAQATGGGRSEGNRVYPPLPVSATAKEHRNEEFRRLTEKIEDGSATEPERRKWYHERKLYYPYTIDALPPKNWREAALQRGRSLALPSDRTFSAAATGDTSVFSAPSKYIWNHLGNGSFCAGDPPAAGCPDKGTGRATAIWVNPLNKKQILLGFADGGVWKTNDQGSTWTPIFDFMPVMTVGSLAAAVPVGGNLNNATIYAATGEGNFGGGGVEGDGIYRSNDGGSTWVKMPIPWVVANDGTSMAPDRSSVRRIAIDPNNSQKVWLAADSGVFRTIDGGASWTLVTGLPYYKKFHTVATPETWFHYWTDLIIDDSTNPSTIYAAGPRPFGTPAQRVDNGIYRSTDDGATWVNISTSAANCPSGRGYSCVGTGFTPGGTATSGHLQGRLTLIHSRADKKRIYALVHSTSTDGSLGIWETTNAASGTVTWTARSTTNYCGQQCWYDMSGAVDPTNPSRVIVGGLDAYVSGDSAQTLNKTSSWTGWGGANYVHADHHHMIWADATTIFVAADGGLHQGTVNGTGLNGVTWVTKNGTAPNAIDALQFYGFAQHPTQAYRLHGGLQDNGEVEFVLDGSGNPTNYSQTAGGDGGFSATDQTNGNFAYEEYVYAIISGSTDGGTNYGNCFRSFGTCTGFGGMGNCSGSCVPDNATEFIAPMQLDPNVKDGNGRHILYTGSKFVYRNNTVGSTTWSQWSPDLSFGGTAGEDIVNIHAAKNNGTPGTVWAVTLNGMIWRTINGTSSAMPTWTAVSCVGDPTTVSGSCTRKSPLPNRTATWVTTDPTNGLRAIVVFSGFNTGHVFRTTDGGISWTDISGALPNEPFWSAAINPENVNQGFIGSDYGIYVNDNIWTSTTWLKISNNQVPHARANELQFSPMQINGARRLRVATHGRGIWELTINNCTAPTVPTNLVATASANNQVTLTWTASTGGVDHYNIYRAVGSCPTSTYFGGQFVKIGQSLGAATNYVDTNVVAGQTYSYKVIAATSATNPVCESDFSTCSSVTPYGNCNTKPFFEGAVSAAPISGSCGLRVSWNFGNSNCPTNTERLVYNVYRGTSASFTPDKNTNMIASCVADSYFDDTTAAIGTPYYYIVRAEDGVVGNGGSCRSGNEDVNLTRVTGTAVAPSALFTWAAGAETGDTAMTMSGSWTTSSARKKSGSNSYFSGYADNSCGMTMTTPAVTLAAGQTSTLSFWTTYDFAAGTVDGGTVEMSVNNGAWTKLALAYPDQFPNSNTNACGRGRRESGFAGGSTLAGGFTQYSIALGNAGQSVRVRWNFGTDATATANEGWYVDDIQITNVTANVSCAAPPLPLQVLTATSTSAQTKLEWLGPASGSPLQLVVRYSTTGYPASAFDGQAVGSTAITAGGTGSMVHTGLNNGTTTYYYSAFVQSGGVSSPARTVASRPDSTAGAIKWVYNTGAASLTAPGLSPVFAVSNDRVLHSINIGSGDWPISPATWKPFLMNSPSQARPGIPTVTIAGTPTKVVYLGTQNGNVYCLNANTGSMMWQTAAPLAPSGSLVQAAVNGIFTTYGGAYNLVFAPTRHSSADNVIHALDASTGASVWSFNNGGGANGIGIISGDPWVTYSSNRLYFTSRAKSGGSNGTFWCLNFTGSGASLCSGYPKAIGDIDGSVSLQNGKLYVGNNAGVVYAFDAATGAQLWSFATSDGPVKGFINADFTGASNRLYFSTTNKVWSVSDNGASASVAAGWPLTMASPSVPVFTMSSLLVGSGDGKLYEITNLLSTPTLKFAVLGAGTAAVGSPSLDFQNSRVYVGTDAGQIYATTFPLP